MTTAKTCSSGATSQIRARMGQTVETSNPADTAASISACEDTSCQSRRAATEVARLIF